LKTGFARKLKKVREKQGPIFPHLEILDPFKNRKKCKNEKFFEQKKVWISSVKAIIFQNTICIETQKKLQKPRPNFSTSGNLTNHSKVQKN
jgi:hypothetical protein